MEPRSGGTFVRRGGRSFLPPLPVESSPIKTKQCFNMSSYKTNYFLCTGPGVRFSRPIFLAAVLSLWFNPFVAATEIRLHDAIERAIAVERIDALGEAARREAEGRRRAAGAIPNPSLFAERESLGNRGDDFRETTIGVSFPVDFLWKRGARIDAADSRAEIAALQLEDRRRRIEREIASLYINYAAAFDEFRKHATAHEALERAQRVAIAATREGDAPGTLLRRVNLAITRHRFEEAEIESRLLELRFLLGSLLDLDEVTPDPNLRSLAPPEFAGADNAEGSALARRPDLKAAALKIEWMRAQERVARGEGRPSASIQAAHKDDNTGRDGYLVGLTVEIPIFDRNQSGTQVAGVDLSRAEIAHDRARRVVVAEARSAYSRWVRLREHREHLEALEPEDNAEALLRSTAAAFEAGETSLLEYLDAVETYLNSWHDRIRMQKTLRQAAIELIHVTASGLER